MRFSEDFLTELKSRTTLSALIGASVSLKRQGREYVGLSPFNKEKSPSFYVNDEKQFYHCFSSGKHGDAITFLMDVERLSFPEAVEKLAAFNGMALPADDGKSEARAHRRKDALHFIDLAARFYENRLRATEGAKARAYLAKRQVAERFWPQFRLGYAPAGDRQALARHLRAEGADEALLVEAGLLIRPEDGRAPFDRFADRLIFPISDPQGRVCGFGGRTLDPEGKPKYLNSPETPWFDKGRLLYRYPEARKALGPGSARHFLLVEGYMDVVALEIAGFEGAVAPLGTALTPDQLGLLWRSDDQPCLCFDGDAAGLRAAYRSIERALPLLKPDKSLRFCFLPDGLDPDDLIRRDGPEAMRNALREARPLVRVLIAAEEGLYPLDTPERVAGLRTRLRARVASIADPDVRAAYGTTIREYLAPKTGPGQVHGTPPPNRTPVIVDRFRGGKRGEPPPRFPGGPTEDIRARAYHKPSEKAAGDRRAFDALVRVLAAPELLDELTDCLVRLEIATPALDLVRHAILDVWFAGDTLDRSGLDRHLTQVADPSTCAIADALHAGADLARRTLEEAAERAGERAEILTIWADAIRSAQEEANLDRDLAAARHGFLAQGTVPDAEPGTRGGIERSPEGEADALRRLQELVRARQNSGKAVEGSDEIGKASSTARSGPRPGNRATIAASGAVTAADAQPGARPQTERAEGDEETG